MKTRRCLSTTRVTGRVVRLGPMVGVRSANRIFLPPAGFVKMGASRSRPCATYISILACVSWDRR